ncbi:MAG: HAD family hydrolase [Cellulosilyticaceae bacterium]
MIFDLDGTLLDSMGVWKDLGSDFLKSQGIEPPIGLRDVIKTMTMKESAVYFRETLGVDMTDTQIIEAVNQQIIDQYTHHIPLKAYVREYIEELAHKGVRMCILTASERSYVEAALQRLGILDTFAFVMTCTELGLNKSNPEIYRLAARQLIGLAKDTPVDMGQVAIFEDALHAARTAKQAGAYVVGVYDLSAEGDTLAIQEVCDCYIRTFEEIKATLIQ